MHTLLLLPLLAAELGPFRQPQIAANGSMVAATFGSGNAIYFSASLDSGSTFSAPTPVDAKPGVISLGRHRGPRIALTPRAIVISAIAGPEGKGKDGDILVWRSTDNGKTWSTPSHANSFPGSAREGLHSMAATPDGKLYLAWLDLRVKGTRLYGASSTDDGKTWSSNELLYASPEGHICECCHPTVHATANGEIYVMFRNWLEGNRDMYVIQPASKKVTKLGTGSWALNACPMDGGGLASDSSGLYSTWRRDGTVYWNELGKPEVELGKGKDPAIAASPSGPIILWNSPEGLRTKDRVLDPNGAYATLTTTGKAVFAAWETPTGIRIEKLN